MCVCMSVCVSDVTQDETVEKFRIDSASGRVVLASPLDYFTQRYYQLTVLAEVITGCDDRGQRQGRTWHLSLKKAKVDE